MQWSLQLPGWLVKSAKGGKTLLTIDLRILFRNFGGLPLVANNNFAVPVVIHYN